MTSPSTEAHTPAAAHSRRWWTLATVALAQLMVVLDGTVVNIALPAAQADLGFSDGDRQWIITAYSLTFGSLLLLGGRLSDLWGRKRTFIIGLIGFAAASALAGAAPTFEVLVAGRALQGAFGALLAPTALAVLTTTFTIPRERARAFGVFGAIAGAGGAIGLLLGGFLTETFDWRWNLYINVLIALVAIVGALLFVRDVAAYRPAPEARPPRHRARLAARSSCSSSASRMPRPRGGTRRSRGACSRHPPCCSSRSCCGSGAPRTRSCRSRSCATATAARPTRRCSSPAPACSASSCSSRTTCRHRSGTRRSRPACRSCR